MSALLDRQREVITALQDHTKKLAGANAPAGYIKDTALALAASVDKLEVLTITEPRPCPTVKNGGYLLVDGVKVRIAVSKHPAGAIVAAHVVDEAEAHARHTEDQVRWEEPPAASSFSRRAEAQIDPHAR